MTPQSEPAGIRILLADSDGLLRQALAQVLSAWDGLTFVAACEDGREAVRVAIETRPGVAVVAAVMGGLNGIEAARQMKRHNPSLQIIVLGTRPCQTQVAEAFRAGASGYIDKHTGIDELALAIQIVHRGNRYVSSELANRIDVGEAIYESHLPAAGGEAEVLTGREREIVQLLAEGHTARDIACCLFISARTVDGHRARIMAKLGIHNRLDLLRFALRAGITSMDDPGPRTLPAQPVRSPAPRVAPPRTKRPTRRTAA